MKIRKKKTEEVIIEIAEKDVKIIRVSEKENETEMLDRLAAVIEKAFGLTESEETS